MAIFAARGIAYHCKHCGETQYVDFVGGTQMVQFGEAEYLKQVELSKKYPAEYPYINEEDCICEECIVKNTTVEERIEYIKLANVSDILEKLQHVQKQTKDDSKKVYDGFIKHKKYELSSFNIFNNIINNTKFKNTTSNFKETAVHIYYLFKDNIYKYFFKIIQGQGLYNSKRIRKDFDSFNELSFMYNRNYNKDWHGIKKYYTKCQVVGKTRFNIVTSNKPTKAILKYKNNIKTMYNENFLNTDNLRFPKSILNFFEYFVKVVDGKQSLKDAIINEFTNILANNKSLFMKNKSDKVLEFSV